MNYFSLNSLFFRLVIKMNDVSEVKHEYLLKLQDWPVEVCTVQGR